MRPSAPPLYLGGRVTLNWFSIVTTGRDLDLAARTAESRESDATTLGSNFAMLSASKATCLEKERNI